MSRERGLTRITVLQELDDESGREFTLALAGLAQAAALQPGGPTDRTLRALARQLPINIWAVDADGTFTMSHGSALDRMGLADDEVVGAPISIYGPEVEGHIRAVLAGRPLAYEVEGVADDVWAVQSFVAPLPGGQGAVAVSVDVTDRMRAEQAAAERDTALAEVQQQLALVAEQAPIGIFVIGVDRTLQFANPALLEVLDRQLDDLHHFDEQIVLPEDRAMVQALEAHMATTGEPVVMEHRVVRPDGGVRWVRTRVAFLVGPDGVPTGVVGTMADLTDAKRYEAELEHRSTHDELTGLANRALLAAQLDAVLARARLHRTPVGVLFVGLDRLDAVVHALGHGAGERVVRAVAARLQQLAGPTDLLCRFGEAQFVLVVEELDAAAAVNRAEKLVEALERPYAVDGEEAYVGAAVGIAVSADGAADVDQIVRDADVAMTRARERSAPRYEVFGDAMREWVARRRSLEVALRRAVDHDEVSLWYQPIVTVADRRLCGAEALARWTDPELGAVSPAEFIPLAEDTGLISRLGEALLRSACRQLAAWQAVRPDVFVSVNLSGHQLSDPGLVPAVASALADAGADPSGLHLEITETVLLDDVEAAVVVLDELKATGVRLCLDDFGTGYSSLTYLCRFPIDVVKVDRSFVAQLGGGRRDASVVLTIVGMAQTLGLHVVAEGVETEVHLAALQSMWCEMAQGFFFSPAVEPAELDGRFGRPMGPGGS